MTAAVWFCCFACLATGTEFRFVSFRFFFFVFFSNVCFGCFGAVTARNGTFLAGGPPSIAVNADIYRVVASWQRELH